MPKQGSAQSGRPPGGSNQVARVPLTARLLMRESLSARRAAAIIAGFTFLITLAGGILERVLDHRDYPTIGRGLWFALQTVTTVGYGDVTPRRTEGRIIAAILMLAAIGFPRVCGLRWCRTALVAPVTVNGSSHPERLAICASVGVAGRGLLAIFMRSAITAAS
jgi:Ion channel